MGRRSVCGRPAGLQEADLRDAFRRSKRRLRPLRFLFRRPEVAVRSSGRLARARRIAILHLFKFLAAREDLMTLVERAAHPFWLRLRRFVGRAILPAAGFSRLPASVHHFRSSPTYFHAWWGRRHRRRHRRPPPGRYKTPESISEIMYLSTASSSRAPRRAGAGKTPGPSPSASSSRK